MLPKHVLYAPLLRWEAVLPEHMLSILTQLPEMEFPAHRPRRMNAGIQGHLQTRQGTATAGGPVALLGDPSVSRACVTEITTSCSDHLTWGPDEAGFSAWGPVPGERPVPEGPVLGGHWLSLLLWRFLAFM